MKNPFTEKNGRTDGRQGTPCYSISGGQESSPAALAADDLIRYGRGAFRRAGSHEEADIILHSEDSSRFMDSFRLSSRNGKLFITGSNPRSVYYGVCEYLKHFGFAFPYPGPEGEIIPENPVFAISGFDLEQTACRTFRGIAARPDPEKLEEGRQLIRFMAQNRYNLFFMEGYDEDRPGDRYSIVDGVHPLQHVEHMYKGKSWEERREIALRQKTMVEEARKYGLLIERGGHGWNYGVPEHFGLNHGLSPEQARAALKAKGNVNKRAEVAVSTWFQLCIGREEVREIYAGHIVDYLLRRRGEFDIAAIWMGDGYDNKCQCDECLKQPFSDLYLDIFRRVALKVRETIPELTLECIIYFETLEPPTRNWLEGLDNVILNLAVWRQCYFHKLDDPECRIPGWIPDYRHNRSHDVPNGKRILNYDQFLAYQSWRRIVGNNLKCLIFNYITLCPGVDRHFMSYDLAPLCDSFADFDRFRFDGMVDCQCHCSWDKPADLQLYGAARMLWNRNDCDPAAIRKELFTLLYREKAPEVAAYCDGVSRLLISCGNYHLPLDFTPDTAKRLGEGLKKLSAELESLGPLPMHRERYFRESLDVLLEQTEIVPSDNIKKGLQS